MSKKIHIINSSINYCHAKGQLNNLIASFTSNFLMQSGFAITRTDISKKYDINQEIKKIEHADIVIIQSPIFWMSYPWQLKKYLDEVLTASQDILYKNDGRSRNNPSKKYGSGGLCQNKYIFVSVTFNCPKEAFNKKEFYNGLSLEEALIHFYKPFEFLGFSKIEPFAFYDVIKNFEFENSIKNYAKHLKNQIINKKI